MFQQDLIINKWLPILEKVNKEGYNLSEKQLITFCKICESSINELYVCDIQHNKNSFPLIGHEDNLNAILFLPIIINSLFKLAKEKPGLHISYYDKYIMNTNSFSLIKDLSTIFNSPELLNSKSNVFDEHIHTQVYSKLLELSLRSDFFIIDYISLYPSEDKTYFNLTINYANINVYNELTKYQNMNTTQPEQPTPTTANFQECAQLEVEDLYSQSKGDTLGEIMNLQKDIQETVYGYDFTNLQHGKLKDLKSFIDWNEEAIRDEQREFANALGGIHTLGMALWKPWKSKHKEAGERSLKDLTPEELLELKYEWIDQLHFFINIGLSIGLNEKEVYNLYFAKNKHNRERQNKPGGY